jgi:hypothetical protein
MKKNDLKKVLKPLIKECIKEAIFEEGVLSNIISEVVRGLGPQTTITESKHSVSRTEDVPQASKQDFSRKQIEIQSDFRSGLEEKKRKLEETLGAKFGGIFENVEPISKAGNPDSSPSNGPLSSYDPTDPGVDISGIMDIATGGKAFKI